MCSSLSTSSIILLCLFSVVTSFGHLRLELTASNDCQLDITTEWNTATLHLRLGEKKTYSFHPKAQLEHIFFLFTTTSGGKQFYAFEMKNTSQQLRHIFEDENSVVLIQSVFECDKGFYGEMCVETERPTTSTVTSTTSSSTTISTTVKTTVYVPRSVSSSLPTAIESTAITAALSVITVILVVLIIVFAVLLSRRQEKVFISPESVSSFTTPKECDYEEPEATEYSPRYTAAPFIMSV